MPDMDEMFAELQRQLRRDYEALPLPVAGGEVDVIEKMLPMADGTALKTFIFRARELFSEGGSYPVILQRSPYFHAMESYRIHGENLARRGFIYVLQCCRGTGLSEGSWEPNVNERADGLETLKWLDAQPWVGSIGCWGDSYLGLTGWCVADAVPAKVKGMYLGVYGTDRYTSAYQKRLFRHDVLTSWAMENAGFPVTADYLESCRYRPQLQVDEALWGRKIPWYRDWISSVKEDDPYWQEGFWQLLRDIPKKITIPILIMEGWYDHHLGSAIKSYGTLSEQTREKCVLRIGSWNHYSMNCLEWTKPENLQNSEVASMVDWFYQLLVEGKTPKKKISVYVIGLDRWKEFGAWPLPVREEKRLYLDTSGAETVHALREQAPENEGTVSYVYDPDDPVPSHGAESMLHSMDQVGSLYQPEPGWRGDVVSFMSAPLEEPLLIGGKIRVRLRVSSDCEDTAFTAKVMEVKPDGRAVNIRSSITTVAADHPGETYRPGDVTEVCVEMWDIAWQADVGSRIRVDVSSSDFPQYAAHTNYPGVWSRQETCRKAHQTLHQGSCLELPLLDAGQAL